jgi:hypothetical protein
MTKELIIETLDFEADWKGLSFESLSPYHLRVTDGNICLDCWPTTGTYRAFDQRGTVKGLITNGRFESGGTDQDIIKVLETVWPTELYKPKKNNSN